jgi:hypothetical protein
MRYLSIRATAALLFLVFSSTEILAANGSLAGRFVDEHRLGQQPGRAEAKIVIAPGDEKPVLDLVFSEEPQ